MAKSLYDKVYSENPFVDELIYYVKLIAPGCIIKNETEADNAETVDSLRDADLYIACYEGRATFELFSEFPREVIRMARVPEAILDACAKDKYNIPESYRSAVVKQMMPYYMENYVEKNSYYRTLLGLPPLNDTDYIYLTQDQIPEGISADLTLPIHEQDPNLILLLANNGTLNQIIQDNPTKDYLRYLDKDIEVYNARLAYNFQLLYMPTTESDVVNAKFKEKYDLNRDYVLKTIYSEAFKYESDYYDNIIAIVIILQTMIDIIGEVQEHIARKDVFDERCIRYIFASYGIPYYNEIPIKYQIRIMKNLNTLLKYKSTPRCMLEICKIFGFDDVRIYKYFLLRDRHLDENGEYVFNYRQETIIHKGEPITEIRTSIIITDETDTVTVPFPFDQFMEKGNAFMVKVDNYLLSSDDYVLAGDQLTFKDPDMLHNASSIEFIFYYNEDGQVQDPVDTSPYCIKTESNSLTIDTDGQTEFQVTLPEGFTFEHGIMNVIIGSVWIDPNRYTIDETGKLTFLTPEENIVAGKIISFLFIYSTVYDLHTGYTIYQNGDTSTTDLYVDLPRADYFQTGDSYYLTIGSTYISQQRYSNTDNAIVFLDSEDRLGRNRTATVYYVYGDYETPEIVREEVAVQATEQNQRVFTVPFPFENYLDDGYQMYVRVGLTDLYDYQYEVFGDQFQFADASLYVALGQSVHFTFIYPKDKSVDLYTPTFVRAETDKQREFTIPWPYDHYLERGNIMIVQYNGRILDESKYELDGDILRIYRIADAVADTDELAFCFYYRKINKNSVTVKQVTSTAILESQNSFQIEFPFFDYLESGNGFFVSVGSTFVDQSRYTIDQGAITFTDGTTIEQGRDVTFTFVYHTIYEDYDKYVNSDTSKSELSPSGEDASVAIPWPYENFLDDEGNSMIVVVGNHVIEPTEYDIFEDRLYFADLDYVIENYGTTVRFEFHYSRITEETILVDDNQKNYDLMFVKVPLTEDIDTYIKSSTNYIDYDTLTYGDPLWDGEYPHQDIKNQILDLDFSYTRTKFISIDNIERMANIMLDMPYFFGILFDDVRLEERLTLKLPSVKANKNFKLNDTFVFLNTMTFEYNGLDDNILKTVTQMLYVKGFNFRADITALQSWIVNKMAYPIEDTRLREFIVPRTSLLNYNQLLNLFNTDMEIYEFVTHSMYMADNKHIYDIFKKIYDCCMRREYSKEFYQIADGTGVIADTYSDYLKYRDRDLYNLIMEVRAITDESTKKARILEIMDNVIRSIDDYIDTDEYRFIFAKYPGSNTDAIKRYVELMINFFKSYKVELTGINTIYTFDDKFENMIRPIDEISNYSQYIKDEYIIIKDSIINRGYMTLKDYAKIKEKIYIDTYWMLNRAYDDRVEIRDKIVDLLIHLTLKDHVTEDIYETIASMQVNFEVTDYSSMRDTLGSTTKLLLSDNGSPIDKVYITRTSS